MVDDSSAKPAQGISHPLQRAWKVEDIWGKTIKDIGIG